MVSQDFSSETAFARWRPTGLRRHLDQIRRSFRLARLLAPVPIESRHQFPDVTWFQRALVAKFGSITWGVFARAFWPIYQPGKSSPFYGSVIFNLSSEDQDGPSLFEIAQEVRMARDFEVAIENIDDFLSIIRDDYSKPMRVPVPETLAMGRGYQLQSIGVHRSQLPDGYLHHRLVPILTHPRIPYATLVHWRYWGEEFTAIWRSGPPLLSEQELQIYQEEFPQVIP